MKHSGSGRWARAASAFFTMDAIISATDLPWLDAKKLYMMVMLCYLASSEKKLIVAEFLK